MHQYTPLSKKTRAIILGSLLGDGSLKVHPLYKNARFSFRHSHTQQHYFLWKVEQLKEISSDQCMWKQAKNGFDGWGTVKWRYQSKALPVLTELFHLTHPHGTFLIRRKWLNLLTPLSLAVWWMDDGSIIANGRKGVICTDSFDLESQKLLANYLKKVWKVQVSINPITRNYKSDVKKYYRLWISSS